jgi:hypothetical protein
VRAPTTKSNLLALAGLSSVLLLFFWWPWVQHTFGFPLGPDAPVYLWWARLGGKDGLSAVGQRPGIPALLLVLTGTLHLRLVAVTAGLEIAMGVGVGLGGAALVRGRFGLPERTEWILAKRSPEHDRPEWLLAGILCGVFAVHLVGGYMANLAFAVAFLAAAAALAAGTRRGAIAAAALLGGGGLSHPQFFVLGAAILVLAAVPSFLRERTRNPLRETEFGRVGLAVVGGAALLGAGLLSMLHGPGPPDVDTSKDALLRRLGLAGELRTAYWSRFLDRSARYVQWVSIPLAIFGLAAAGGFVGRVLRSWGAATVLGVVVALATAWFPADRFVTFGYVVPILAALGLVRLARAFSARRTLAVVVCGALGIAMVLGAAFAWRRQAPFISDDEVRTVTTAGRYLSASSPETASVFFVAPVDSGLFELPRASNVIRAALPPDRIRSAVIVTTQDPNQLAPPSDSATPIGKALDDLARHRFLGAYRDNPSVLTFALRPFLSEGFPSPDPPAAGEIAPGVETWNPTSQGAEPGNVLIAVPTPAAEPVDPLVPSSPAGIALATIAVLGLLAAAGYGWARAWLGPGMSSIALAPAFGLALLTIAGILLDRLGVSLAGSIGPTIAAILAGGGGYLTWLVLQRRALPQPTAEVDEQPHE